MKLVKSIRFFLFIVITFIGVSAVSGQYASSQFSGNSKQMKQEVTKQDSKKYNDEVSADEIDPAVASAIVEKYPGYGIVNVYQAKDESYKIKLEKEDDKVTAYVSNSGELLKVENNSGKEEDENTIKQKNVSPQE